MSPELVTLVNQSSCTQWYCGEIEWDVKLSTRGIDDEWFLLRPRYTARLDLVFHLGSFVPSWRAGLRMYMGEPQTWKSTHLR
jgi:hypothetical protein